MLQDLAAALPSLIVGVAFLLILFSVLRREAGHKSSSRSRHGDSADD